MEYLEADLTILQKETNLGRIAAEQLLTQCDGDVVTAILRHTGEEVVVVNKNKKELTEVQQKIKILRDIVDKKDEILDNIMESNRK